MKINNPKTLWDVEYWYNTSDGYDNCVSIIESKSSEDAIKKFKKEFVRHKGAKSFKATKHKKNL